MVAFDPKWVNPVLYIIGVNSLRLGSPHLLLHRYVKENLYFDDTIFNFFNWTKDEKKSEVNSNLIGGF